MTTLRTAAQQALEALMNSRPVAFEEDAVKLVRAHQEAIHALRAALAEAYENEAWNAYDKATAEPAEPVAWMVYTLDGKSVCVTDNPSDFNKQHKALPLYTAPTPRKPLVDPAEYDDARAAERYNRGLK